MHQVKLAVSEEEFLLYESWKDPALPGGRILRPVQPKTDYTVVVTCVDDRFLVNQSMHLTDLHHRAAESRMLCRNQPSVCVLTMVGGGLRLSNGIRDSQKDQASFVGNLEDWLRAKGVRVDTPVEVWLYTHADCGYRRYKEITLKDSLVQLNLAAHYLERTLTSQFTVRRGMHIYWPVERNNRFKSGHRSYEIDVVRAIKSANALDLELASQSA